MLKYLMVKHKKMGAPYPPEAVRNARVPISHAHIHYGRLQTY